MCTIIGTQMYILKLRKMVMNMEQNTKHAARETQIDRQVEKKTGRAAARRNAPKLPRAIRVGPKKGAENIWGLYRVCLFFFINTGGLSEINPGDLSGDKSPDKAPVS